MMNQHEIASPVELLDQQGHLLHPGYATRMQWQYDPRKIKARPFALKEWDFFQVQSPIHLCWEPLSRPCFR